MPEFVIAPTHKQGKGGETYEMFADKAASVFKHLSRNWEAESFEVEKIAK